MIKFTCLSDGETYMREKDCENSAVLDFHGQGWHEVDLSPLRKCLTTQKILLNDNRLSFINLEPVRHCVELVELNLFENFITILDLSPLSKMTNLEEFDLSNNELSELDLMPLQNCSKLNKLGVNCSSLLDVDISPLVGLTNLKVFEHNDKTKLLCDRSLTGKIQSPALRKIREKINFVENEFKTDQTYLRESQINQIKGILKIYGEINVKQAVELLEISEKEFMKIFLELVGSSDIEVTMENGIIKPITDKLTGDLIVLLDDLYAKCEEQEGTSKKEL